VFIPREGTPLLVECESVEGSAWHCTGCALRGYACQAVSCREHTRLKLIKECKPGESLITCKSKDNTEDEGPLLVPTYGVTRI